MLETTSAVDTALDALASADADVHVPDAARLHPWPFVSGVLLLAVLLFVGAAQQGMKGAVAGELIGQPAPDFTLTTFDGRAIQLSDFRGRPVVINFWASWCPPCRTEAAALGAVARAETASGRAVFIGVDVRDSEDAARRFLSDFSVAYAAGPDPGGIETAYRSVGIPYTVFVAADGTIARTWLGPLDEQRLLTIIDEIA
jgi:cytochrome c biogenesis protein CcmG, thiol:disulfide interchange protein DsbE